jgi:hypothetical protein
MRKPERRSLPGLPQASGRVGPWPPDAAALDERLGPPPRMPPTTAIARGDGPARGHLSAGRAIGGQGEPGRHQGIGHRATDHQSWHSSSCVRVRLALPQSQVRASVPRHGSTDGVRLPMTTRPDAGRDPVLPERTGSRKVVSGWRSDSRCTRPRPLSVPSAGRGVHLAVLRISAAPRRRLQPGPAGRSCQGPVAKPADPAVRGSGSHARMRGLHGARVCRTCQRPDAAGGDGALGAGDAEVSRSCC